ncbi:MAG: NUMOD4 domain-containing protein [Bacteroidaceae bacterium]|nr:NUMOD4 domain-containing protein [Bacteroidaceae bacterium]
MIGERWLPIPDYNGVYEVSDRGNVRSVISGIGYRIRILKQEKRNGYLSVNLYLNGKAKHHYIHRLVAMAFIPNPENKREVNHIDCNKHNNDVSNLEWCDRKYNLTHSYENGLKRFGENHGGHKLTEEQVREIRELRGIETTKEIAKRFGIAQCTVSAIHLRRIWKEVV